MTEVAERYERIADGFSARLAGVAPGSWSAATPCTEWTVRDLVVHVGDTQRRVLASIGGEAAPVDPDGDLAAEFRHASTAISDVLADEERAASVIQLSPFGEQSFESLVGRLLCSDTLLHTWDLARATGQDEQLDPVAVAASFEFLTPLDETIRRPGGFAPKVAPPEGADTQTRFLYFAGRPS
jgi:uncharacterized protein (TIGR03086 family)